MSKAKTKSETTITAEEFDRRFDEGEDITEHLDLENAVRRVNVDFPVWMLRELDAEAARLQVPRQAVIKMFIDQQLRHMQAARLVARGKPA